MGEPQSPEGGFKTGRRLNLLASNPTYAQRFEMIAEKFEKSWNH